MKVVELDPANGEGWRVLGNAYAEVRMHEDAANAYKKAIALDPEDAQTMNNLGLLRIQQREYMAALYPLARATELAPKVASFQNNLGVALEKAGYPMFAADAYRAALAADEKYEKARASLERITPVAANAPVNPIDLAALAADFAEEVTRWQSGGTDTRGERDDLPGGYTPGR
jgi:Flp pilus assembly protein TadD